MSSVQTSAWPTCVSSENYHLWTLALNFCHILPDAESGSNGKCRWQLPLANWQHSAKYIIWGPLDVRIYGDRNTGRRWRSGQHWWRAWQDDGGQERERPSGARARRAAMPIRRPVYVWTTRMIPHRSHRRERFRPPWGPLGNSTSRGLVLASPHSSIGAVGQQIT